LLCTYVGDYFYGYVTSSFYTLSTVVVEQCFRRVCIISWGGFFPFGGGPRIGM